MGFTLKYMIDIDRDGIIDLAVDRRLVVIGTVGVGIVAIGMVGVGMVHLDTTVTDTVMADMVIDTVGIVRLFSH